MDDNNIGPDLNKLMYSQLSIMDDLISSDTSSEFYRKRAVDAIYQDQNYTKAMELINVGLKITDKHTEPLLYELRFKLLLLLNRESDALKDMTRAVNLYTNKAPCDYQNISEIYQDLFSHYYKKCQFDLAANAIFNAIESAEKLDEQQSNFQLFLLYRSQAKLNVQIGNNKAALLDEEKSKHYEKLYRQSLKNDEFSLPF